MKSLFTVLASWVLSSTSMAFAQDVSLPWPVLAGVPAETVLIKAPRIASANRPTEIEVLVGSTSPCAKVDLQVEHRDDFTHVVTPHVREEVYPCVQVSRFDYETIALGTLRAGEHRVLVENVSRAVAPASFWVADDVSVASKE